MAYEAAGREAEGGGSVSEERRQYVGHVTNRLIAGCEVRALGSAEITLDVGHELWTIPVQPNVRQMLDMVVEVTVEVDAHGRVWLSWEEDD